MGNNLERYYAVHFPKMKEGFQNMWDILPGLKRVTMIIIFVGGGEGGKMVQQWSYFASLKEPYTIWFLNFHIFEEDNY